MSNHFDSQEVKDWLVDILKQQVLEITFKKVSGELRTMKCTLNPELLPKQEITEPVEPPKERKPSETSLRVFDVTISEWRAFKWDSIISLVF